MNSRVPNILACADVHIGSDWSPLGRTEVAKADIFEVCWAYLIVLQFTLQHSFVASFFTKVDFKNREATHNTIRIRIFNVSDLSQDFSDVSVFTELGYTIIDLHDVFRDISLGRNNASQFPFLPPSDHEEADVGPSKPHSRDASLLQKAILDDDDALRNAIMGPEFKIDEADNMNTISMGDIPLVFEPRSSSHFVSFAKMLVDGVSLIRHTRRGRQSCTFKSNEACTEFTVHATEGKKDEEAQVA